VFFPRKQARTTKPNSPTGIDWSSPLAKGLKSCFIPTTSGYYDVIAGKNPSLTTGTVATGISGGEQALACDAGAIGFDTPIIGDKSTVFGVIKTDAKTLSRPIGLGNSATGEFTGLLFHAGGNLRAQGTNASAGVAYTISNGNYTNNKYHKVSLTTSSGSQRFYVDNLTATTTSASTAGVEYDTITLGGRYISGAWDATLTGDIAVFMAWDRVLSENEIRLIHENPYQLLQPRTQYIDLTTAAAGGTNVSANTDTLTLTEYPATIHSSVNVACATDALTLTEYTASISLGIDIAAGTDALAVTEYTATVNAETNITSVPDTLTLTTYPVSLSEDTNVSATTDALTLSEYAASINAATNIETNIDSLTVSTFAASVVAGVNILATTDALSLTEYAATVRYDASIQATVDALTLATYQASISIEQGVTIDGENTQVLSSDNESITMYFNGNNYFIIQ